MSVIISPPITPNKSWGFNKRNSQEITPPCLVPILGNITQSFTPKYSQGINWRNECHLGYTRNRARGDRALVKTIFEAPKCLQNSVFEAPKLVSTKTPLLKYYCRRQGLGYFVWSWGINCVILAGRGEAFLLTVGAFLLTVKLLCLQSLRPLIRRTFPL